MIPCPRCGGSGVIEQFRHIERGVCYECRGSGCSTPRRETPPRLEPTEPLWPYKEMEITLLGRRWRIYKEPSGRFFAVPDVLWPPPHLNPDDGIAFVIDNGQVMMLVTHGSQHLAWGVPTQRNLTGGGLVMGALGIRSEADEGDSVRERRMWDRWFQFLTNLRAELQRNLRR